MSTDANAPAGPLGNFPEPDMVLIEDYKQKNIAPSPDESRNEPKCFLRVHMDIEIDKGHLGIFRDLLAAGNKGQEIYEEILKIKSANEDTKGAKALRGILNAARMNSGPDDPPDE
ncbi:MAG: hypothetical protein H0U13_01575 [Gemmatimonadaceae bacterium]|nr:hypothetical protein [Gemmatimonadaceae bacterium]